MDNLIRNENFPLQKINYFKKFIIIKTKLFFVYSHTKSYFYVFDTSEFSTHSGCVFVDCIKDGLKSHLTIFFL